MAITDEVNALTDAELKARLEELGKSVGPIVASTRAVYRRMLLRILDGPDPMEIPHERVADNEGVYERVMEFPHHEEFSTQESESSMHTRRRQHSHKGDSYRELTVNKGNEHSKAVIQSFLIIVVIVAIICLFVYLFS